MDIDEDFLQSIVVPLDSLTGTVLVSNAAAGKPVKLDDSMLNKALEERDEKAMHDQMGGTHSSRCDDVEGHTPSLSMASKIARRVRWIIENEYDRRNPFLPKERHARKIYSKVIALVRTHLYD